MRSSFSCGHSASAPAGGVAGSPAVPSTTNGRPAPCRSKPMVRKAGRALRYRYTTSDSITPASTAISSRTVTVARAVARAMANSLASSRQARRQAGPSNSDQATTISSALTPASGIHASTGPASATSSTRNPADATPANGVRAPASRFGSDRFSDPHTTMPPLQAAARLPRPWPRHSRLASSVSPVRAASVLAMAMDCPSATIASASAACSSGEPSASRRPVSSQGQRHCGRADGGLPTRSGAGPGSGCCVSHQPTPMPSSSATSR